MHIMRLTQGNGSGATSVAMAALLFLHGFFIQDVSKYVNNFNDLLLIVEKSKTSK